MSPRLEPVAGRFAPGQAVVRREILRGEVWFGCPTICVEDSPDLLALYLPPGASSASPSRASFRAAGIRGRSPGTPPGRVTAG
ncbi:hypothetical protein [Micromonospora tarapacensis]|uniref:hypothetical protein n=1 Tax=Micromonospora tarapacensis TaxID=2835305 RepID=UPI001E408704|nr:hypothetical protein [Micromonospora tarapacensis]